MTGLTARSIPNTMAAMPSAKANGIDIAYETTGDPTDPTLLLVCGLGSQLINFDPELCELFVARGLHVVRFDNRDVGQSTHIDARVDVRGAMRARAAGEPVDAPYTLSDMAADAVGLLDHLGVDRAHVFGTSMGGMIGQTIAVEHPARVRTLVSVMSTTGELDVGGSTPEAGRALLAPPARTREEYQEAAVRNAGIFGSPGLFDPERLRARADVAWDRGYDAFGVARQLVAVSASGSRAAGLAALDVPTLVIHGTEDTLIQPSGGRRTAELIPGAELLVVDGMGHDLAPPLWPRIVDAVAGFVAAHPD
jgi:pimeloyl-ACP methyl ester carboxylesterase